MNETNWTSIDMYYKGFHVKKSWPKSMKAEKIIKIIDKAIDLNFVPSWNKDTTSEALDPTWVREEDYGVCAKCGAPNAKSKKGNLYCSKKCWLK